MSSPSLQTIIERLEIPLQGHRKSSGTKISWGKLKSPCEINSSLEILFMIVTMSHPLIISVFHHLSHLPSLLRRVYSGVRCFSWKLWVSTHRNVTVSGFCPRAALSAILPHKGSRPIPRWGICAADCGQNCTERMHRWGTQIRGRKGVDTHDCPIRWHPFLWQEQVAGELPSSTAQLLEPTLKGGCVQVHKQRPWASSTFTRISSNNPREMSKGSSWIGLGEENRFYMW